MDPLDDRLRAAMAALDGATPARTFDEQADKILARMEEPMEADVSTPDAATGGLPPPRTDDSGLHDIKALARTTRQRVSKRITSQHDIDASFLESSHSGLRVVALPEPARLVSLPSVESVMATSTAPAVVRAAQAVANDPTASKRRGVPIWAVGGVGALAAAALAFVVIGGGKKAADSAPGSGSAMAAANGMSATGSGAAAGSGSAATGAAPMATAPTAVAAPSTPPRIEAAVVAMAASGSAAGSAADAPPPPPTGTGASRAEHGAAGDGEHHAAKVAHDPKATDKAPSATKPDKGAAGAGGAPGGPKSLDQLIDDAAGGPTGGGGGKPTPADKPVLDKKELTSSDIRKGMGSATGQAKACFDQLGVAGTVGVRAVVAPSGQVTKVVATGAFAGTPTGNCVADAVKGVSFPAWDGPPMTINYSYLLSE